MAITLKFVGALRHASGAEKLKIDFDEESSIRDLIKENLPELKRALMDNQSKEQITNALVLVNGREISVLSGLETKIKDLDEVVFVPVIHGG
jgi:molybdopterin synthase sulfur carrier subunit